MKELQIRDLLNFKFLAGVTYNPSGPRAAFTVANSNEEENCYESRLYLYENGAVRQLTDMGKESRFVWEDDDNLLFPAVRKAEERKKNEVGETTTFFYRLNVNGGEAMPAFSLPFGAGKLLCVGNGKYVVTGTIDSEDPDNYLKSSEDRRKAAAAKKEDEDYHVLDEIPFWGNGQGFTNKERTALFLVDGQKVTRVTAPAFDVDDVVLVGEFAYFSGSTKISKLDFHSDLWRLNTVTGEAECLIAASSIRMEGMTLVGDTLLVKGTESKFHGLNENAFVYRYDDETKSLVLVREEDYSMYSSVGGDCRLGGGAGSGVHGGSLYHITTRWGNSHIYRLDLDGTSTPVFTPEGSVDCMAVSEKNDTILMVAMLENRLQELYSYEISTGKLEKVTSINDAAIADTYVAEPKRLTITSCDLEIEGWVLEPKDYDPSKNYPAVLDIHGGPKTVYGPVYTHEMQVWANRGYFVMFCNPKGGDGRGNDFADIRGEYGHTDYQNIMDFTDEVLRLYPQIDGTKVAVTGGSYGGFMTNWIIGHTDRFACAASQRSISNWISFYGISDIGTYFASDQCDGNIYDDAEKLWNLSPLKYAANVKTPTLFIHSDEDYRCPMAEGLQMYTALVDRGIPARLCWFKGENHELSRSGKPKHRLRRLQEITDWIEKYTK